MVYNATNAKRDISNWVCMYVENVIKDILQ